MRWRRVAKEHCIQPSAGSYKDWKHLLAAEASNQCVYCAIHESCMGGVRVFHVEHYRPKSKFAELVNDFRNLFYCCPICNAFKGDDWPGEPAPDHSLVAYPDPSEVDYCDIISMDPAGTVMGSNTAGRYLEERLYLNRGQLIIERRLAVIRFRIDELVALLQQDVLALQALGTNEANGWLIRLSCVLLSVVGMQAELMRLRPYGDEDLSRTHHG